MKKKKNIICSPISVSLVLSMVTFGAKNNTKNELKKILQLPANDTINKNGFQLFIEILNNYKMVQLNLANKIFIKHGFEIKNEFKLITESSFKSSTENVDFKDNLLASKTINSWCEEKTNNRIKDLIKSGDIDGNTALVMVNAVYFKGNWANQFNPEYTKMRDFYIDESTTKKVPTMFRNGFYNSGIIDELDADYLELPYKSFDEKDALSMFVIVPNEINGLKKIEDNFHKVDFSKLNKSMRSMDLILPKFKFESSFDLGDVMKKMGLKDAFEDNADFSGISDSPLKISKIIQKAFIEVDEVGTEAAAVTGIQIMLMCMPPRFSVDKPFLAAIVAKNNNTCLFTTRIMDPTL